MNIQAQIAEQIKDAMKSKNQERLLVLRSLKAKLLEKEVSIRTGGQASLSDEQIIEVLMKAAKQRKESIEQFRAGNRSELAEKEAGELKIIEEFLPKMLGEEEIRALVKEKIQTLGLSSSQEMGRLMGTIMPLLKGKADGGLVNKIVKEELS